MIGLEPSALNPKQNEQAMQWHVIKTSDGGGFIEKKLVVDEKQTEQSCSFTLKKL